MSGGLFVVLFLICSVCAADIDIAYSFGDQGWTPLVGNWDGYGNGTALGVYNAGNWYIDYNGDGQFIPSTGDRYIPYGTPGWTQLVGDWNGDGKSEIGIYKDAVWYLDYGGSGVIDANTRYYQFGAAGWTPLIGDWNGDKKDEIGIYQDGNWYLDYNGNGVWDTGDLNYGFGTTGWTPVVGKWTADGISKIGIYNAGNWYIDYNGDGQFIPSTGDKYIPYGAPGWTQLVSDWNGDGKSEIGIYKDAIWYLDYGGSGVIDANTRYYQFGAAGWTPVTGDWNGDKKDKIGVYQNGNWYLDCDGSGSWTTTATVPSVEFTSNVRNGTAPLMVMFSDQSSGTGQLTYAWDFTNDGVIDSTIQSPSYTYATSGIYSVNLTVTNSAGSDSELKTGYIMVNTVQATPAVAFTSDVRSGTAPLRVRFTDQSTGTDPMTYKWDFNNDGETDSTAQNPSFTYTTAGPYSVNLTVTNAAGSDSVLKTDYINVTQVAPHTAFTSNVQSGTAPLGVRFTDQSTGTDPMTYKWDFNNDGETDSTAQNPSFTYTTVGTYSVNLTVTNAAGSDSVLKTDYIDITPAVPPHAAFTSDVQSGTAPLRVRFTDHSTGSAPLIYAWDFNNDSETDSTAQNPLFWYSNAGTYSVTLTISNGAGSDTTIQTDHILVEEGPPVTTRSGIAITFDDNYIDEWYAIRDILQAHNAHVTFFVSNFASLDQAQINKLKTLQADGHEIAYHGYAHVDAAQYMQTHSINNYLENEIINGVNLMKSEGFNPVDFAYPFGSDDPEVTQALGGYFDHVRDTAYSWDDSIYYEYGSNQYFIAGIGMDDITYGIPITDIYNGISRAKNEDKILILYGHEPVAANPQMYQTSHDRLEKILQFVSDNNLKTFTISELH